MARESDGVSGNGGSHRECNTIKEQMERGNENVEEKEAGVYGKKIGEVMNEMAIHDECVRNEARRERTQGQVGGSWCRQVEV